MNAPKRLHTPKGKIMSVQPPVDAQRETYDALRVHFDRSAQPVTPEQVSEMTGLGLTAVHNALRVLHGQGSVEGLVVAEFAYPLQVTAVR